MLRPGPAPEAAGRGVRGGPGPGRREGAGAVPARGRGAAAAPPLLFRGGAGPGRDWPRGRLAPECSAWRVIEERP